MTKFGGDQQEPAARPGGLQVPARFQERGKEVPEVVNEHEQVRGETAHLAPMRAKSAEAPLVLKFVEDVFRVIAFSIQHLDLPGAGLGLGQVGDVGREPVFALRPEGGLGERGGLALEFAGEDDAALAAPTGQLHAGFGDLPDAGLGGALATRRRAPSRARAEVCCA